MSKTKKDKPKIAGMDRWWVFRYQFTDAPENNQVSLLPPERIDRKPLLSKLLSGLAAGDTEVVTLDGRWTITSVVAPDGSDVVKFALCKRANFGNFGVARQGKFTPVPGSLASRVIALTGTTEQWLFVRHDGRTAKSSATYQRALQAVLAKGLVDTAQDCYYGSLVTPRLREFAFSTWRKSVREIDEIHFRYFGANLPLPVGGDVLGAIEAELTNLMKTIPGSNVTATVRHPIIDDEVADALDDMGKDAKIAFGARGKNADRTAARFDSDDAAQAWPTVAPTDLPDADIIQSLRDAVARDGAIADGVE